MQRAPATPPWPTVTRMWCCKLLRRIAALLCREKTPSSTFCNGTLPPMSMPHIHILPCLAYLSAELLCAVRSGVCSTIVHSVKSKDLGQPHMLAGLVPCWSCTYCAHAHASPAAMLCIAHDLIVCSLLHAPEMNRDVHAKAPAGWP